MAITGLWSRIQGGIVGLAVGQAAGDVLRPIFEPLRQESWQDNPNRVLQPGTLAELVAKGITEFGPAAGHAAREGFGTNAFRALVEGQLGVPAQGQAMEAFRRNLIDEAQFRHVLTKAAVEPGYHDALVALRTVLPSVTDLIRMAVREVFNPQQRAFLQLDAEYPDALTDVGERIGLSRTTLGNYWAAHWELPSYTQLTEMRFRNLLSPQEFSDALKAIDIAPLWRPKLEAIARRIPTISDMVRFAYREVYDDVQRQALGLDAEYPDAFTAQAALHGMSETHAKQYWAAHWRLPSAMQGYRMLHRNVIELPELNGLLKALDYPPLWRDRLRAIAYLEPGRIDLKRLLRYEIFTRQEVREGYERLGYRPEHAEALTRIAEEEMTTGVVSQKWAERARSRLFTVTHDEFLDGSIDEGEAGSRLSLVGALAGERSVVMNLWSAEAAVSRTELTAAQVRRVYYLELRDRPWALSRLDDLGYSSEDANLFLDSGPQAV